MAYITASNLKNILFSSDLKNLNLKGEVYHIPIYFFSFYETNSLLAIKELLINPERYFNTIYNPYKGIDTFNYIYEGNNSAYHENLECPRLQSDYMNFEIPSDIKEKGPETVKKFRKWFEEVKDLIDKPDAFGARLQLEWGINTNIKSIKRKNGGSVEMENFSLETLEKTIDNLIKEAGRYYYKSPKNKAILSIFSKETYIAYNNKPINNPMFPDNEIKNLLKEYDLLFKKPLKKYLIEYYRLKFNPDIKMEGYLLEALGFNYCRTCYESGYKPEVKVMKPIPTQSQSSNPYNDNDDLPF
jgi:hypothetical protein